MSNKPIPTSKIKFVKQIAVIGGGIAGSMTALHLRKQGHDVSLIEPRLNHQYEAAIKLNASEASLGVLMGNIYNKTSGRSWRLRKRSMELWPELLRELSAWSSNLRIETPLVKLGTSEKEVALMTHLADKKKALGVELLDKKVISYLSETFKTNIEIALISKNDGRIHPKRLMISLMKVLNIYNVKKISEAVVSLSKSTELKNKKWKVQLSNNDVLETDIVVICASLASEKLLRPLGHTITLEPILGQILELEVDIKYNNDFSWPAVINLEGYNFILDKQKNSRMLVGATIEKDFSPNEKYLNSMRKLIADNLSKPGLIKNQWYGIRARPTNEPSPIMKNLESGLLINTGHYRNGILLAPACAEWISQEIIKEE